MGNSENFCRSIWSNMDLSGNVCAARIHCMQLGYMFTEPITMSDVQVQASNRISCSNQNSKASIFVACSDSFKI